MLKYTNKKVVNLQDWDDLVQKTYGRPYSFQQQDGGKSRGTYEFQVPSDDYESDFENDTVPEKYNFATHTVGVLATSVQGVR